MMMSKSRPQQRRKRRKEAREDGGSDDDGGQVDGDANDIGHDLVELFKFHVEDLSAHSFPHRLQDFARKEKSSNPNRPVVCHLFV